jgi:hypothetical protein
MDGGPRGTAAGALLSSSHAGLQDTGSSAREGSGALAPGLARPRPPPNLSPPRPPLPLPLPLAPGCMPATAPARASAGLASRTWGGLMLRSLSPALRGQSGGAGSRCARARGAAVGLGCAQLSIGMWPPALAAATPWQRPMAPHKRWPIRPLPASFFLEGGDLFRTFPQLFPALPPPTRSRCLPTIHPSPLSQLAGARSAWWKRSLPAAWRQPSSPPSIFQSCPRAWWTSTCS